MFKDNRTIEEIEKNILLLQEQADMLKKETEAIKKKGEEELNALKKETEEIKKENESNKIKGEEELNALKKETEEITQELKKSQKDLNRQMYNMGVNIGLGVEDSIYNVLSLYKSLDDIKYDKVYKKNVYIDETQTTKGESDIIMVNGHHAAIIEIKHRITTKHIRDFYKKILPLFIQYETKLQDKQIHIYFAGDSLDDDVIQEAKIKGCGILEPMYNDILTIVKAS